MIAVRRSIKVLMSICLIWPFSVYSHCFNEAGEKYNISPKLLQAICFTESSLNGKAINESNNNGTIDVGLCQINSWWYPKLEKYGISQNTLLNDACANTHVSAWILAQNFHTSGEGWLAVGAYNVGYEKGDEYDLARKIYVAKVMENLEAMQ